MNENYFERYVNENGKVVARNFTSRINMIFFAGTKFILDRILAILGLILCLPLMIIIAIAIKVDSKGPVFFKQERTGKNGKTFTMYKFRTMVVENDVHDFSKKDKHTRVGNILRKTSLDEIPQMISIAIGKMSFIGPRPWIPDYFDNMNDIQRHRFCVRPGLTGLAQAKGRNDISIIDKINYDLEYIENYSLKQDIKIILLTIKAVFTAKGADAGKATIQNELEDLKKQNKITSYAKGIQKVIEYNEKVKDKVV